MDFFIALGPEQLTTIDFGKADCHRLCAMQKSVIKNVAACVTGQSRRLAPVVSRAKQPFQADTLQRDGSWGWNNAGLIVDGDQSLLVDTLFDVPKTEVMLKAMRSATKAANTIGTVINTHANGDHCWARRQWRASFPGEYRSTTD